MMRIKRIGFVELIEIGNGCFDVIIIRVRKKRRNGIYLHVWMAADGHCSKFLPDSFLNSSSISSLPLDFGIFPINKRVLGSLTFTFKIFPSPISYESSCRTKIIIVTTCKVSFEQLSDWLNAIQKIASYSTRVMELLDILCVGSSQ